MAPPIQRAAAAAAAAGAQATAARQAFSRRCTAYSTGAPLPCCSLYHHHHTHLALVTSLNSSTSSLLSWPSKVKIMSTIDRSLRPFIPPASPAVWFVSLCYEILDMFD